MRTFAYCRVSTTEQTTETQLHMIRQAGFDVLGTRAVQEEVSGSVPASKRPGFQALLSKLEAGDTLVVLKLDRLGRDSMDVQATVESLLDAGIRVVCLDLPAPDLSSATGKLMLQVFAAFSEFERNRIRERTREALATKKAAGIKLGRPVATKTTEAVQRCKLLGLSQSQTAAHLGCSIRTVKSHWNTEV